MLLTSLPLRSRPCPRALPALRLGAHLGHSELLSYQVFVLSSVIIIVSFSAGIVPISTDGKQNLPRFPTPCLLSLLCSGLFCRRLLRPDWGLDDGDLVSRSCGLCLWLVGGQHLLSLSLTTLPLCARVPGISASGLLLLQRHQSCWNQGASFSLILSLKDLSPTIVLV